MSCLMSLKTFPFRRTQWEKNVLSVEKIIFEDLNRKEKCIYTNTFSGLAKL